MTGMRAKDAAAPQPIGQEGVSPYAWYVLAILFLVYVLNFIDRQILAILAEDIKRDLNLTDADIGFLFGTAFGVFYALFGIPLGRLADSWHRVRLMSIGLALWSAMTALSGFARSGLTLSGARIGVGIGEAGGVAPSYALIADYFPVKTRSRALAIYSLGLAVPFWIAAGFSGAFMRFLTRFRRHLGLVEKAMGGLLVLTGLAFIFGYVSDMAIWFQQTFPILSQIG